MPNKDNAICYLCGKIIDRKLKNNPMELSMDHVPPKQFFPKQIRETQNLNLNSASSHRICNESYKNDEEYFYHSLYPIVATNNPQMGRLCEQDIQRRAEKPQSHRIIQQILSTKAPTTEGGIYLPPGLSRFTLNGSRLERIAAKIARGILFSATERYFKEQQVVHIDFYANPSEIIDPHKQALQLNPLAGVYPDVFAHSHINFQGKGFRLLIMFFWKAFWFYILVKDEESERENLATDPLSMAKP